MSCHAIALCGNPSLCFIPNQKVWPLHAVGSWFALIGTQARNCTKDCAVHVESYQIPILPPMLRPQGALLCNCRCFWLRWASLPANLERRIESYLHIRIIDIWLVACLEKCHNFAAGSFVKPSNIGPSTCVPPENSRIRDACAETEYCHRQIRRNLDGKVVVSESMFLHIWCRLLCLKISRVVAVSILLILGTILDAKFLPKEYKTYV